MNTFPLYETAQGIVDSNGNATLRLQPHGHGVTWKVDRVDVRASSSITESTCTLYVGTAPIQANYRDQTFTGSTGDYSDRLAGVDIRMGSTVWAVWSSADIGAAVFLSIVGSMEVS